MSAPSSGTSGSSVWTSVKFNFNEALSPTTTGLSGFYVVATGQTIPQTTGHISGTLTYFSGDTIVTFAPNSGQFAVSTWYIPMLTSGIQSVDGLNFSGGAYFSGDSFLTEANPFVTSGSPVSGATLVGISGATVVVNFSTNMTSITTSGFYLVTSGSSTKISGTLSMGSLPSSQLTFTPNSGQLLESNWYIPTLISGVVGASGLALSGASPVLSGFPFQTQLVPVISGTTPVSGATGITNNQITITFSNTMKSSTINTSGIYVVISGQSTPQTTGHLSGVVSLQAAPNDNTGIFTANSGQFANTTWYEIMVTSGCQDLHAGNVAALTSAASFQTGTVAQPTPQVSGTTPVSGAKLIQNDVNPVITMNTSVTSASTQLANAIILADIGVSGLSAASNVAGVVSLQSDLTTIVFSPNANITDAHYFKIEVSGLQNLGLVNQSPAYSGAVFTTWPTLVVSSTTPASGVSGIRTPTTVTQPQIVMSRTVDSGHVNTSSISLVKIIGGTTSVAGVVSLQNDMLTIIFTPNSALTANSRYRIEVSGVQDLASGYNTAFSGAVFATEYTPFISGSNPLSGAGGVVVDSNIVAFMGSGTTSSGTVTTNTVTVLPTAGGAAIAGAVSLSSDLKTITFNPNSGLGFSTQYSLNISGVQDTDSNFISINSGNVGIPNSGIFFTTAAPALTQVYNVGSNSSFIVAGASASYKRGGEGVADSSSKLKGDVLKQVAVTIMMSGTPVSGDFVFIQIRDGHNVTQTDFSGIPAQSVASTWTQYTFTNLSGSYALGVSGVVWVMYSGTGNLGILKNGKQPFNDDSHTFFFTYQNGVGTQQSTDAVATYWT